MYKQITLFSKQELLKGMYHKSNLVYAGFFPQFFIFQKNNNAET